MLSAFAWMRPRQGLRGRVLLCLGLGLTALPAAAYETNLLRRLELDTVDARFSVRGAEEPPADLIIVAIDETTFNELGIRWPFPRSLHAEVIDRLREDGAQAIGYDVQFTEETTPGEDNALIESVAGAGNVVLATNEVDSQGRHNVFGGEEVLAEIGARAGCTCTPPDPGGVYRRYFQTVSGLETFAVATVEAATGREVDPAELGGETFWIDYHGPPGTIEAVSFSRVLEGRTEPGLFRGKIVVVGATAPSLQDVRATPTTGDELMSGAELEANAISTVLRGFPLKSAPRAVDLALIALLGLLAPALSLRLSLRWVLLVALGLGAAFVVTAQLLFNWGTILSFVYPLGALVLGAVAALATRYALTGFELARARAGAARVAAGADARVGSEVAGYRIERVLGRGAQSVVYLAEHRTLRRKVALKVLGPELAEDEREHVRARLLRESQIVAALDHPHVIQVYDAGELDGTLYIAMRYVDGADLGTLVRRQGRLEPARTLEIVGQVAGALDAAHARGLVHKDVKPANILVAPASSPGEPDRAYLADFGLTKLTILPQSRVTTAGKVEGTLEYIAPEQIAGEDIDGRADLYSLGCVLYEALTGAPPFRRDSELGLLWAHLQDAPPPLAARWPDLPTGLDTVIGRALAKSPEDRYATCGELVAAARAAAGL